MKHFAVLDLKSRCKQGTRQHMQGYESNGLLPIEDSFPIVFYRGSLKSESWLQHGL
jgi:hypothetical protein